MWRESASPLGSPHWAKDHSLPNLLQNHHQPVCLDSPTGLCLHHPFVPGQDHEEYLIFRTGLAGTATTSPPPESVPFEEPFKLDQPKTEGQDLATALQDPGKALPQLDGICAKVKASGYTTVTVDAYTSIEAPPNVDPSAYNYLLSERRAAAIVEYLKKCLPAGVTITGQGHGGAPAGDPAYKYLPETDEKNRRVEITISK